MSRPRNYHPLAWRTAQGFAETHCVNCVYGWTRTGENGSITVCLLDQSLVMTGMTDCDRYETRLREEPEKG
jgi:hypothetical protein